jgi:hypothetical protein
MEFASHSRRLDFSMSTRIIKNEEALDNAGMTASLMCAAHCALLPIVVTLLPVVGLGFLAHETTGVDAARAGRGTGNVKPLPRFSTASLATCSGCAQRRVWHCWRAAAWWNTLRRRVRRSSGGVRRPYCRWRALGQPPFVSRVPGLSR